MAGSAVGASAGAGFGPAPKYVEQTPLERRIVKLYGEDTLASAKPYQYGPKTGLGHGGVQDVIRAVAGDRTESEARTEGRRNLQKAAKSGDQEGVSAASRELVQQGHVSPSTVKSMLKGGSDTAMFSRLPATDQIKLASTMSKDEFEHYVIRNPNSGITKVARAVMISQYQKRNLNQ